MITPIISYRIRSSRDPLTRFMKKKNRNTLSSPAFLTRIKVDARSVLPCADMCVIEIKISRPSKNVIGNTVGRGTW